MTDTASFDSIAKHYNDLRRDYEALLQVAVLYSLIIDRLMKPGEIEGEE